MKTARIVLFSLLLCLIFPSYILAAEYSITEAEWASYMSNADFAATEQHLNSTYKELMASLEPDQQDALKSEQRAWAAEREKSAFDKFSKGSPEYIAYLSSMANDRQSALEGKVAANANSDSWQEDLNADSASSAQTTKAAAIANEDKEIVVEAEGRGATKIEALKSAWTEAVRLAIGMYLNSKSVVVNDDITEEIVTHSRGKVNSYEELHSEQTASGWIVLIRAKIERDILKEATVPMQKQKVALDSNVNANMAAEASSMAEKQNTGAELLKTFEFPELETFFNFKVTSKQKDGKIYGLFDVSVNMDAYKKIILEELSKILDQVAIKRDVTNYPQNIIDANVELIRQGKVAAAYPPYGVNNGSFGGEYSVYIALDAKRYAKYTLTPESYNVLRTKMDKFNKIFPVFTADVLDAGGALVYSTNTTSRNNLKGFKSIFFGRVIAPVVMDKDGGINPCLVHYNVDLEVNLSPEELLQAKDIEGSLQFQQR